MNRFRSFGTTGWSHEIDFKKPSLLRFSEGHRQLAFENQLAQQIANSNGSRSCNFWPRIAREGAVYLPRVQWLAMRQAENRRVNASIAQTLQFANLVVWIVMVDLCWQVFMPSGCSPALLRTLIGLKPSVPQRFFRQISSKFFAPLCFHILDPMLNATMNLLRFNNKFHRNELTMFFSILQPQSRTFPNISGAIDVNLSRGSLSLTADSELCTVWHGQSLMETLQLVQVREWT